VTHTRAGLAALLGGTLEGSDGPVNALRDPTDARPSDVVVARHAKYLPSCLESPANLIVVHQNTVLDANLNTRAGARIAREVLSDEQERSFLRVPDLEIAWERLLGAFFPALDRDPGIHPSAQMHPSARLGQGVHVGPNAVISRDAVIGDGCVILAGALIGEGSSLGRDCLIHPNVSVLHHVTLGDRVIVQSGAVIGSDGFGFRRTPDHHHIRLPHIGSVVLGDDVEIGANSVVDRATVGETRIGARTKIGPACIVAHNSVIGQDVLLIGAVQLAGSITIHDRAVLWGQVGAAGHITIGADATVTGQSGVSKSLPAGGTYRGSPAQPINDQLRLEARIRDLERLTERIKLLEERLGVRTENRLENQPEDAQESANESGNSKMNAHIEPSRGKHST
jgi:UDP-3-O-[3-hydroxymyristoyl] glucosamine N-acyltransferase